MASRKIDRTKQPAALPPQALPPAPPPLPPVEVLAVRPRDAARMLGVGLRTLWRLVARDEIEVKRISPVQTLVVVESLRRFLARPSPPARRSPNSANLKQKQRAA